MKTIELINIEKAECCELNTITGDKSYYSYKAKKIKEYTGFYTEDAVNFFVMFPTITGLAIWYSGRIYSLNPGLKISLNKKGKDRIFTIKDYGIKINYIERDKWLALGDVFSDFETDEDVDLFYLIQKNYKNESFYKQYGFKNVLY